MAQSLKTLAEGMRVRAKRMDSLASEVSKVGLEAMLVELVAVTPVDTSTAISNWQISIGGPPFGELPAVSLGHKGSTEGVSANKTLAEGRQELQYKKPGEVVFLSNLTPYIGDLDNGTSSQFSGGFIARALIVFRLAVDNAVKQLLR